MTFVQLFAVNPGRWRVAQTLAGVAACPVRSAPRMPCAPPGEARRQETVGTHSATLGVVRAQILLGSALFKLSAAGKRRA